MLLVRLSETKTASDSVPDENEWHAPAYDSEYTACGLAWGEGAADRNYETKRGRLRDVTCNHCHQIVEHYKKLR